MTILNKNGEIGTSKKTNIICNGDSWVFGCEIVDPTIAGRYAETTHPGEYDYIDENDNYRLPRIFPTHLAKLLDAEVTNLSWPADDNGSILNRTIHYITENYISKGLPTDNIFVIIGWSSPERNSFWFKDDTISHKFRLWPNVPLFGAPAQKDFWEIYVSYMWNAEEYLSRYVMNVLQLQSFCNANDIKWLCFNSFYQTPNKNINEWTDLNVNTELKLLTGKTGRYHYSKFPYQTRFTVSEDYESIWASIDPVRFYKKDLPNNTFKSFIQDPSQNLDPVFNGWHPSPVSHEAWAHELGRYIDDNKLL